MYICNLFVGQVQLISSILWLFACANSVQELGAFLLLKNKIQNVFSANDLENGET